MKRLFFTLLACLPMMHAIAQDVETKKDEQVDTIRRKGMTITVGPDLVRIERKDGTVDSIETGEKKEKTFKIEVGMFDFGINSIDDKTNYASAEAQAFLNVPADMKNANLFSLRQGKSVNVNVWPVMAKWRVMKSRGQKIYISTGLGLQMYNFRFTKDISYLNVTNPEVILDTVSFTKNKLAFTYLSIPLQVTFKTRLAEKAWLVYGVGVTGGYRINSLNKQISGERGKVKNHDKFNFEDLNACITGEIGLNGYFRLYASYQLTPMHEYALDQHPYCIGLRFGGM